MAVIITSSVIPDKKLIRQVVLSDLSNLGELARTFLASSQTLQIEDFDLGKFISTWSALITSGIGVIFIVGNFEGAIGGIVRQDIYGDKWVGEELFWFVKPESRGVGIALYQEFEQWCGLHGASSMQMVHINDLMPGKVRNFYLRSGFREVETRYAKSLKTIEVIDDFLFDPKSYQKDCIMAEFKSYHFADEDCTFHGISPVPLDSLIPTQIIKLFPSAKPTLSFLRKSPLGQVEPHYIHTDTDMGEWSAILYLNDNPPDGDGTTFWKHKSGVVGSFIPHERSSEGQTRNGWTEYANIKSKFNRLLIFKSELFHSRSIFDNWGDDQESRLTQITFGKGKILV